MARICIIPKASNPGGVTSFQRSFISALAARGIQTCSDLNDKPYDALLLTSGVRKVVALRDAHSHGIRIVQRLDGINWLHRRLPTGLRHFLRAEYGNRLLALIRSSLATHVIYQSAFAQGWWRERFGPDKVPAAIIHNSVDLSLFSPKGPEKRPEQSIRLLLVEGSLQGGYEAGLESACELAALLNEKLPVELSIAGAVSNAAQARYNSKSRLSIQWKGLLPHKSIPALDRSAHLLYSADINAACPNSVLEALGCGLPVIGFATGALSELVTGDAGRLVPYGSDPWKLGHPNIPALADAAWEIVLSQERFRSAARQRAEEAFGVETMVDRYLEVLLG